MRRLLSLLSALLLPLPALADDGCHDLWFTRNLIMDRAGYCFGSTLGQAVFDNRGCTGKSVSLGAAEQRLVTQIRALEQSHGCRVNTGQPWLDLDDVFWRQQLWVLPVRDEFESACLGWLGSVIALRAGPGHGTAQIGQVLPGDYVGYAHIPVGGWTYVTTHSADWQIKSGGWFDLSIPEQCRDFAG